jgi:hypothetical protein
MSRTLRRAEGEFSPAEFVKKAAWQEARKPFRGEAHEYAIRGRGEVDPEWHDRMIEHITEHGTPGEYAGTRYRYLDVGDFTLWVSRGIYQPYAIINRRRRSEGDPG